MAESRLPSAFAEFEPLRRCRHDPCRSAVAELQHRKQRFGLVGKAEDAGAEFPILEEPTDRDYGSREFICADPEGNVWSFGTYWPKASDKA